MALRELSTNEQLDEALRYILKNKSATPPKMSQHFFLPDAELVQKQYDYITEMLLFLRDEGYIKTGGYNDPNPNEFTITFKGIQFINDGGYTKRAERESILENAERIRTLILTYGSALAGVGAIAVALIELYKLIW